jgi:hypothetical protein
LKEFDDTIMLFPTVVGLGVVYVIDAYGVESATYTTDFVGTSIIRIVDVSVVGYAALIIRGGVPMKKQSSVN